MSETNAQRLKRLRADAAARGLCYVRRLRHPRPGVRSCDDCLRRVKEVQSKGRGLLGRRRRGARADARLTATRIAAGLCPRCGLRPPLAGYRACGACLDRNAAWARVSIRAMNGSTREPLCSVCGQTGHNKRRHERLSVLP